MSKKTILATLFMVACAPAFAGGLTTNTNQNAMFLRQLSQEAVMDINGLYANPAGTAFLGRGVHLSLNVQNARQSRDITTVYPLMAYNRNFPGEASRKYHGSANAPVIPSATLSYNWERWSMNAHFGLTGGGGKCEFDNGLGTFESMYSAAVMQGVVSTLASQGVPAAMAQQLYRGYDLNAYMKGRQYYFGFQLGGTYKILDNLAAFAGLRGVWASNNYNGWVTDINAYYVHPVTGQEVSTNLDAQSLDLNTDQTGFGITPIVGLDWKVNKHWNVAAKFEGRTKLNLKNKSEMNAYTRQVAEANATLGQFKDGSKVRADLPGIVFVGTQYSPIEKVRLNGGFHYYFDKLAKQHGGKEEKIDHGTWEATAGAEYDVHERVTVSAGWQITRYGLSDEYMNDLSFVTNSNSIGVGVRVKVTDRFNVDLGFMQTLYHRRDVTTDNYLAPNQQKSDHYWRKNRVLGVGFNMAF